MATVQCRRCRQEISDLATTCPHCGCFVVGGDATPSHDFSRPAMAAFYLGLISVLMIPAPFAIVAGVLGLRDLERNPTKHGRGRALFGIVMGMLGTIGLFWGAVVLLFK